MSNRIIVKNVNEQIVKVANIAPQYVKVRNDLAVRLNAEDYEGNYNIIPSVEPQVLPTKNKALLDDITIKSIPYYETENNSSGFTVYIGTEI